MDYKNLREVNFYGMVTLRLEKYRESGLVIVPVVPRIFKAGMKTNTQ